MKAFFDERNNSDYLFILGLCKDLMVLQGQSAAKNKERITYMLPKGMMC